MKLTIYQRDHDKICRSREGAWIEIVLIGSFGMNGSGRSREGAWIEIAKAANRQASIAGRSREGAWIEIANIRYY